jgi:hypothetical protein
MTTASESIPYKLNSLVQINANSNRSVQQDVLGREASLGPIAVQRCIHMAMNSGPDAEPDLSDAEVSELDTGPLQDSQDAIDRGREAAREALKEEADSTSGQPEEKPEIAQNSGGQREAEAEG